MMGIEESSPPFEMDNRGKRSVVLDVTTEAGRAAAFALLEDADVFVTNVRPGALRRIGLAFEEVAHHNPRLIYGLITGYGESGPTPTARPTTSRRSGRAPDWRICSPGRAIRRPFSAAGWATTWRG